MSEGARIRSFMAGATREAASLVTRRLALAALSGVVMRTPVDTGRARGAWMVTIGAASGEGEGAPDKGGGAAINAGLGVIGTQTGFQPIVIQNNVPYIGRLNDGHSNQAPKGFVEGTLASLSLGTGRD